MAPEPDDDSFEDEDVDSNSPQREYRSGYIESVEVWNFMCHRHLLVKLLPTINFIYGANGSGKSAILTALTVCLGGRASATQRAGTVAELIREGSDEARVRITLWNGGKFPYRPAAFGSKVIVERRIYRDRPTGSSSSRYLIFGALSLKAICERRDEVLAICDHFGIQVDNPLAVLTQETAKRFLATSKPKDFYEFFMKATHLEQLAADYQFAQVKLAEADAMLVASEGAVGIVKKEIGQLRGSLRELERYRDAHRRIQALRTELTWAMVEEAEAAASTTDRQLQEAIDRHGLAQRAIEECTSKIEQFNKEIAMIEDGIRELSLQSDPIVRERTGLERSLQEGNRNLRDLQFEAETMNRDFKSHKRQLAEIQARLAEEQREGKDEAIQAKRQQLGQLADRLQELYQSIADTRAAEQEALRERESLSLRQSAAREKVEGAARRLREEQATLVRLKSASNDRVRIFGDGMGEALKAIAATKWSKHRPVGPVGLHVTLKDSKWALAIEAILGRQLEAFLVHSHADRHRLEGILQRHKCPNNPIIVVDFDNCGQSFLQSLPTFPGLRTAWSVLEIGEPIVLKALVIMCGIERILLEPDRQAAFEVMRREAAGSLVYTPTHRIISGASGSISYQALYSRGGASRVFQTAQSAIDQVSQTIENLTDARRIYERDLDALTGQANQQDAAIRRLLERIEGFEQQILQSKRDSRRISEELEETRAVPQESILERERASIEESIEMITAQYKGLTERQEDLQGQLESTREQLQRLDEALAQHSRQHGLLTRELEDAVALRRAAERSKVAEEAKLPAEQRRIVEAREATEKASARAAQMCAEAGRIAPRVPVTRSIDELDRDLTALEAHMADASSQMDAVDPNALEERLKVKIAESTHLSATLAANQSCLARMQDALEMRMATWEDFRSSVAKNSNVEFIFMMNARGFTGHLEYLHEQRELHIRVQPPGQKEPDATMLAKRQRPGDQQQQHHRDVRQLSGGEKSYSTACFLISLWNSMGSPIRCLDEFDVFMDPVNRRFILDLLISHARRTGVQFLLITPISVTNVLTTAPDVRIIKLRDPERGQTTIC